MVTRGMTELTYRNLLGYETIVIDPSPISDPAMIKRITGPVRSISASTSNSLLYIIWGSFRRITAVCSLTDVDGSSILSSFHIPSLSPLR